MMTYEVVPQLKTIIAEKLDLRIPYAEIRDDVSFFEDGLGLDSIALVEFITLVEETFQLKLTEEDLSADVFKSLQSVAELIAERVTPDEHAQV
ncbi:MAG: acyl carrier protein [Myxococcota bacterium]